MVLATLYIYTLMYMQLNKNICVLKYAYNYCIQYGCPLCTAHSLYQWAPDGHQKK